MSRCACIQVRMYPGGAYALPSSLASIINLIPSMHGKDRAADLCGAKIDFVLHCLTIESNSGARGEDRLNSLDS